MSKKKTRLMRVPESFYRRVKGISEDFDTDMVDILDRSDRILENASYLSKVLGRHKKK